MSDKEQSDASSSHSSSGSESDPVQYEIDVDGDAAQVFETAVEELSKGNKDLAKNLFTIALDKFEGEYDDQKATPEFQYKWASCLRATGMEICAADCLQQSLDHYKAALHLLDNRESSPTPKRAKMDDDALTPSAKQRVNIVVGQACAAIDLLTVRGLQEDEQDSDDDDDEEEQKWSKPGEQERSSGIAEAIRTITSAIEKLPAREKVSKLVALSQALQRNAEIFEAQPTYASAVQQCKNALTIEADNSDALLQLGSTYLAQAKTAEVKPAASVNVIDTLKLSVETLNKAKSNPAALPMLGEALLKLGTLVDEAEASKYVADGIQCYLDASEAFPDDKNLQLIVAAVTGAADEPGDSSGEEEQ